MLCGTRNCQVSIHAPAWGATAAGHQAVFVERVSIHAPAWGATARSTPATFCGCRFNSRSRVGSDSQTWTPAMTRTEFQFTLPRGERRVDRVREDCGVGFQFTLPRGERRAVAGVGAVEGLVSIHAPAWGATE